MIAPDSAGIQRIDRQVLAALQADCTDFGAYYCWLRPSNSEEVRLKRLRRFLKFRPRCEKSGNVRSIIESSKKYAMVDGLLYRRVRSQDGEELRPCAPSGTIRQIFGVVRKHPVKFRKELLHHYHSGVLGHHIG